MGLFANRAATRMGARQQYRTMARMQRRRSAFQSGMGMRQDFQPAGEEPEPQQMQSAPAEPSYKQELEQLAQLKNEGVLTTEEYTAKKKQILGI